MADRRTIRGIRDTLPSGVLIGRVSTGDGPSELLTLHDLAFSMVAGGAIPTVPGPQPVSVHAIADGSMYANISGATAVPTGVTVTAYFDNRFASTRGTLIYRGASTWNALAAGTSGQILKTQATAGDPVWVSIAAALDDISSTQGAILYRGSSTWVALGPGTTGQFLKTQGAAANPVWADLTGGTVTSITAGTGLNVGAGPGGTITSTGTLNLADTAVVAAAYTNANITVDAQGRLTAAASGTGGNGMLPLVTGDLPPTAIGDDVGQMIGVPL